MMIKLFEEFKKGQKIIGYHVTNEKVLPNILNIGLEARAPEDFGDKGDLKGVYLFKTIDDCEDALMNWFGEKIEEWEDDNDEEFNESLIVVDLTGLDLLDSVGFEWTCLEHISPDRFLEVLKYDEFNTNIYPKLKAKYEK